MSGRPAGPGAASGEAAATGHRRLGPGAVLDAATQALDVAGSLLIGADVLGRGRLGRPVAGVPEIVAPSIVAIVFLQIPAAFRAGRLTRSDALLGGLRRTAPRAAAAREAVFDLAAIAMAAVIVRATWPLLLDAWRDGDFVGAIGTFTAPTWPVKAAVVLGGALLVARIARHLLARLGDLAR